MRDLCDDGDDGNDCVDGNHEVMTREIVSGSSAGKLTKQLKEEPV